MFFGLWHFRFRECLFHTDSKKATDCVRVVKSMYNMQYNIQSSIIYTI